MTAADETRKLTTILAIDVVGYSAAAERDQVGAVRGISALRARIAALATAHGGRLFNTAGDGFMLEFPLASAAVRAAITLLDDVSKPDTALPRIRAGAHLGEVMIDQDDLLGHGVNVASRLMSQAEPNALVISEAVKAQLHGEIDQRFTPLGSVRLPKMREPVFAHGYAPGATGAIWRRRLTFIARRRWRGIAAVSAVVAAGAIAAGMIVTQPVTYDLEPMLFVAHSSRPEVQPTLSPDGQFIVYMVEQGDQLYTHTDLFMRSVAGGEETALTTTTFIEAFPSFSPTGDRLAYARWDTSWREEGTLPCQIFVRDFPNGLDRQVGACEGNGPIRLAWTPDGRSLVYSDTPATDEGVSRIRALDLETGTVRDLVPPPATGMGDMAAHVSPDGNRVAFVRYASPEVADVHVYDLRRGRLARVTNGLEWAQVAWADERNLFVVTAPTSTGTELWLMRADGGTGQRVLPGLARLSRPDTVQGLLAVEVQTSAVNLLRSSGGRVAAISEGNQFDYAADFSRDGVLAFVRRQAGDWLYLQAPGEQPRRLVGLAGGADDLRWSPDGRRLAFTDGEAGRTQLRLVDVASGLISAVELDSEEEITNPTWSPDGQSIVFARLQPGGPRLFRVRLQPGAQPEPISDYGWFSALETSEGLFAVHRSRRGIWRLTPGRPPESVFADFVPLRDNSVLMSRRDWTVSGGHIYLVDSDRSGGFVVLSRALEGGPTRRVADVDGVFENSLAIDPLSGDAVFGVAVQSGYDVAVIPFSRR